MVIRCFWLIGSFGLFRFSGFLGLWNVGILLLIVLIFVSVV